MMWASTRVSSRPDRPDRQLTFQHWEGVFDIRELSVLPPQQLRLQPRAQEIGAVHQAHPAQQPLVPFPLQYPRRRDGCP
jgi:hypothetical protein